MKHYGNIELINGKILNFTLEEVPSLPTFNVESKGLVVLNEEDGNIYFNNGTTYAVIPTSASSSNVRELLGSNWINEDFSVNPVDINNLNGISGITSDSSLYDIIVKVNDRIDDTKNSLTSLTDTNFANLTSKQLVYYNGESFSNISLSNLFDSSVELTHENLADFTLTTPKDKDVLLFNNGKFVNKHTTFRYNQPSPNNTHFVEHSLGEQLVNYVAMDLSNNKRVIPSDVTYTDTNNTIFYFDTPVAVQILISSL